MVSGLMAAIPETLPSPPIVDDTPLNHTLSPLESNSPQGIFFQVGSDLDNHALPSELDNAPQGNFLQIKALNTTNSLSTTSIKNAIDDFSTSLSSSQLNNYISKQMYLSNRFNINLSTLPLNFNVAQLNNESTSDYLRRLSSQDKVLLDFIVEKFGEEAYTKAISAWEKDPRLKRPVLTNFSTAKNYLNQGIASINSSLTNEEVFYFNSEEAHTKSQQNLSSLQDRKRHNYNLRKTHPPKRQIFDPPMQHHDLIQEIRKLNDTIRTLTVQLENERALRTKLESQLHLNPLSDNKNHNPESSHDDSSQHFMAALDYNSQSHPLSSTSKEKKESIQNKPRSPHNKLTTLGANNSSHPEGIPLSLRDSIVKIVSDCLAQVLPSQNNKQTSQFSGRNALSTSSKLSYAAVTSHSSPTPASISTDFPPLTPGKSPQVEEIAGDLFSTNPTYALAHCVASDFQMSAGIAVDFKTRFGGQQSLLNQNKPVGDVAILNCNNRTIFYLITKKASSHKPDIHNVFKAIKRLATLCQELHIPVVAMLRIASGLDGCNWSVIKKAIVQAFGSGHTQVKIYTGHNPPINDHPNPFQKKNKSLTLNHNFSSQSRTANVNSSSLISTALIKRKAQDKSVLLIPKKDVPVKEAIKKVGLRPNDAGIRRTIEFPSGAFLIKCNSTANANQIKSHILNNDDIDIKTYPMHDWSVRIHNIDAETSADEINEEISIKFGSPPINVSIGEYKLPKKSKKLKLAYVSVSYELYQKMAAAKSIRIGWSYCNIDTKILPIRCTKCNLLGHRAKFCKEIPTLNLANEECLDCVKYNLNNKSAPQRDTKHNPNQDCPSLKAHLRKLLSHLKCPSTPSIPLNSNSILNPTGGSEEMDHNDGEQQ